MKLAYDAVMNGMSVRQAAEEHDVPRSTLGDRILGRTQMGSKSGPSKILTDDQEECLVNFLMRCASVGYAKSKLEVMSLIDQVYKSRGINKMVTNGWWESFCK
jgi:transposase